MPLIKKEILQEQGAASIMEALRNTPGITMQLGENGNTSAGDTFQMRGFSTQSSMFLDGVRDLGAVTPGHRTLWRKPLYPLGICRRQDR